MTVSMISEKGQITLPAAMRRQIGLSPGDRVQIEASADAIIIRPVADFFAFEGFLGKALDIETERKSAEAAAALRNVPESTP